MILFDEELFCIFVWVVVLLPVFRSVIIIFLLVLPLDSSTMVSIFFPSIICILLLLETKLFLLLFIFCCPFILKVVKILFILLILFILILISFLNISLNISWGFIFLFGWLLFLFVKNVYASPTSLNLSAALSELFLSGWYSNAFFYMLF